MSTQTANYWKTQCTNKVHLPLSQTMTRWSTTVGVRAKHCSAPTLSVLGQRTKGLCRALGDHQRTSSSSPSSSEGGGRPGSSAFSLHAPYSSGGVELPPTVSQSTGSGREELQLTISRPTLLLNHMAERYTSTPRVLMEFVDNAIDDAEAYYKRNATSEGKDLAGDQSFGYYERGVEVNVFVCKENKSIRVVDNCRGMPKEVLQRVVLNVGESKKRGVAFLNGQYGFGMQAFRTCCESLTVQTKTSEFDDAMEITLGRWQMEGFAVEKVPKETSPIKTTGTAIHLQNFDEQWMDETFSASQIAKEIELHFERLLARPGLTVNVTEEAADGQIISFHRCEPFDYGKDSLGVIAAIDQSVVWPELEGDNGMKLSNVAPQKVNIRLCVSSQPVHGRIARFFVNGRRIKEVAGTRSFTAYSKRRWTVWAHPNVLGFIDISNEEGSAQGGALQPVITRDEFKRTRYRKRMFEYLIELCEQKLEKALSTANKAQSDNKLVVLEDILTNVLSTVSREDNRRRAKGGDSAMLDSLEPPEGGLGIYNHTHLTKAAETASRKRSKEKKAVPRKTKSPAVDQGFNVRLIRGDGKRSELIGNTIYVDIEHEDFKNRMKKNRMGHERFDDRICGYLATIIAAHYQDRRYVEHGYQPSDSNQAFQDMIDVYVRLEAKIRSELPSLLKQIEALEAASAE
ncbi:hypothetical protein HOP50_10g61130 [Chloropicon primus]|uniref:Histidine kinase-like ATPase n=2 Tax=Chloropicon primus TaxID=1764295 RepID=A0A5B8MUY5_9CHLO|nr:hypothetical protein A3770_10p60920 [Chloropicon primus]UPR02786.1 hypothetical protein HOP50_10g61130 [Chloropicon primus]|eukprot:QDZ23574.1 hypothetical protein A3770_10p60920 [Chloropicon primus]